MDSTPAPGENIAVLRKARGLGQEKLARMAGISLSYLSKIEVGLRPATPPIVAALAEAMRVPVQRIYGQPFLDQSEQADLLTDLRAAVRRYTLPKEDAPDPSKLGGDVTKAMELRAQTKYLELLGMLPKLLGEVTASALSAPGEAGAWTMVSDVYGCAYAVAHRLAQPDLADMIVSRQAWAAQQTWNPEAEVAAAWNEAGVFQSAGAYDDGLAVIERAISKYESSFSSGGPVKALALGSLHLRGIVLASRHKDAAATTTHLTKAQGYAAQLGDRDILSHNLTFGPDNTALYELAAHIELGRPDKACEMAGTLLSRPPGLLTPNRMGRMYVDIARARLDTKDHVGAEQALAEAFKIAPQMAEVHPMSREVIRVLFVLHQRARPALMEMAKRAGLTT